MRSVLAFVVLVAATRAGHADARQDIVDIRHHRMPNRTTVLGWTADGAFVFRRTACEVQDLSDIPSCAVDVVVAKQGQTSSYGLFGREWSSDCVDRDRPDPSLDCWKIPTADAMSFIAAERDLLAKLGPLTAGTSVGTSLASGTIKIVHYNDEAADRRRVAIVLSSGGHWRPLRVVSSIEGDSNQFIRNAPRIDQVERSPDGRALAIVTTLPFMDTDFYFDRHGVDVVTNPDLQLAPVP